MKRKCLAVMIMVCLLLGCCPAAQASWIQKVLDQMDNTPTPVPAVTATPALEPTPAPTLEPDPEPTPAPTLEPGPTVTPVSADQPGIVAYAISDFLPHPVTMPDLDACFGGNGQYQGLVSIDDTPCFPGVGVVTAYALGSEAALRAAMADAEALLLAQGWRNTFAEEKTYVAARYQRGELYLLLLGSAADGGLRVIYPPTTLLLTQEGKNLAGLVTEQSPVVPSLAVLTGKLYKRTSIHNQVNMCYTYEDVTQEMFDAYCGQLSLAASQLTLAVEIRDEDSVGPYVARMYRYPAQLAQSLGMSFVLSARQVHLAAYYYPQQARAVLSMPAQALYDLAH